MTAATFDTAFDFDFYLGSGLTGSGSKEVPGRWDCAIAGHTYMIDRATDQNGLRGQYHRRESTPTLRNQADVGEVPSEQSINRDGLWRRSQESWHHGAGQTYYDRSDSDTYRFHASKNLNVWDKWRLALLPQTSHALTSSNTNLYLTSVGTALYVTDGQVLKYTTDLSVFTSVTGNPAQTALSVASDGYNVWTAYGPSGIYSTTRAAAAQAGYVTGTVSLVAYVHGRLMAANGPAIYNITAGGALPAALLTQNNSDFQWVGFAEGPGFIYAAGYSGTRSLIYKITLQPDGTALTAPSVASRLPIGETVRSITGYLGYIIIGTDKGVRLAQPDGSGNLTPGAPIATTSPVTCFEPNDRFIWYGLTNYDTTSTGLGRVDLSVFTQPLVPAYASDLMATTQGAVQAVATFSSRRVFTVSGSGVWAEQTGTVCASGTISFGKVTYGVGDDKVAMYVDLRHEPLVGSIDVSLTTNNLTTLLGSSNTSSSTRPDTPIGARQERGEAQEPVFTLNASGSTSPVLTRWTLRAYPAPSRTFSLTIPLILASTVTDLTGQDNAMDTNAERLFLEELCLTQQLVTYQEGTRSFLVLIEDFTWIPVKVASEQLGYTSFDGTFVVTLKEVSP